MGKKLKSKENAKNKKKGLSTVIVTLIIILISLVAIGVFWVVVNNLIQGSSQNIGLEKLTVSVKILGVSIDNSSSNVTISIKRNVGAGDLIGMKFVFYNGSYTEIITEEVNLKELGTEQFVFHLSMNISSLSTISIVPIFSSATGEENVGNIADSFNVRTGKRIEPVNNPPSGNQTENQTCTPAVNPCAGRVCGTAVNGTCGNINCAPGCSGNQTCNSTGQCVNSACVPTTCAALGHNCGTGYANGTCGGTLSCGTYGNGSCQSGYNCFSGTCFVQTNGSYLQGFENVTFPPAGWTTGGNVNWYRNIAEPDFGTASATSGKINGSQMNWLSYNHTFTSPGNVSFFWNVSSEYNYDFACFCVDKVCGDVGCSCSFGGGTADVRLSSSPSGAWTAQNVNFNIDTPGTHMLTWCYAKDGGVDAGVDMVKLDNIRIN
jgi:hypothetical protein